MPWGTARRRGPTRARARTTPGAGPRWRATRTVVPAAGRDRDVERRLGQVAVLEPAVARRTPPRAHRVVAADVEVPRAERARQVEHEGARPDPAHRDAPFGSALRLGRTCPAVSTVPVDPGGMAAEGPSPGRVGDVPEVRPALQPDRVVVGVVVGVTHTRPDPRPPAASGASAEQPPPRDLRRPVPRRRPASPGPGGRRGARSPIDAADCDRLRASVVVTLPARAAGLQPPTTRSCTPRDPRSAEALSRA